MHPPRTHVRFATLLVTLVVMLGIAPVLEAAKLGVPVLRFALVGVLLAAVFAVSGRPRLLGIGVALALPALIGRGLQYGTDAIAVALVVHGFDMMLLGFAAIVILRSLLETDEVTADTIYGGISVYLLLAMLWYQGYSAVELIEPGSFERHGVSISQLDELEHDPTQFQDLIYFSFVTITTLGYGDVTPATPLARALSTSEAVIGQLFLAVFIARLVGLYLAHRMGKAD